MVESCGTQSEIRPISGSATHLLRQAVLRPHQKLDDLTFPGDDAPDTLHVGAFCEGALVAVATVCREAPAGRPGADSWRLRGMATNPSRQRHGHGRALVQACVDHAARRGGRLLWCHARVPALGFYRSLAFRGQGDVFELPDIGPHLYMEKPLP